MNRWCYGKIKRIYRTWSGGGGFYVAWNVIPPYFNNYQFQDALDDIARKNSYTTATDDDIKKMVVTKADTEDIKLREDQVIVTRKGDGLGISVKYKSTWTWLFIPSTWNLPRIH